MEQIGGFAILHILARHYEPDLAVVVRQNSIGLWNQ
jgi:hypothetical protein